MYNHRKNIRRVITTIAFFPISYLLSLILYPNTISRAIRGDAYNQYFYKDNDDQINAYIYNPGILEYKEKSCFAPTSILWPMLSLKEYSIKIVNEIILSNNNDDVNIINVQGLDMGGAAAILAADLIIKKNIRIDKPLNFLISNTFSSLHAVIMHHLEENGPYFKCILMFLLAVTALIASFFLVIPNTSYAVGIITISIALNICFLQSIPENYNRHALEIFNISTMLLTTLVLLSSGILATIPLISFLLTNKYTAKYTIYVFLEAMGAHMDIRSALERILEHIQDSSNLSMITLQVSQVDSDLMIGSAKLCMGHKNNNNQYGADYYINSLYHTYIPSEFIQHTK